MAAMAMRNGARLPRRSDRSERTTRVRAGRMEGGPRVAVVGVSGAVGQEFLRVREDESERWKARHEQGKQEELEMLTDNMGRIHCVQVLEKRNFPYSDMKMLASKRSAGKAYEFDGQSFVCEELNEESLRGVDIALFSAGGSVSKKFAPIASDLGCTVVDNSSAFRMTEGVPLVIPEVNPEAMAGMKYGQGGIIANPNCSTIICLVAVTPLHKKVPIKRMVVSTYQAASGAGQAAMDELELQTKQALNNEPLTMDIFGRQYAFNLFSHNSDIGENGYNEEEMKLVKETGKIWSTNDVQVTATCIRVPVMRAHAESINLEFSSDITEEEARQVLAAAPGVSVYDNRAENDFPTPLMASNKDDVFVGRIRRDISRPDNRGLDIFICGDQIRKGAALNAVQVAELLL